MRWHLILALLVACGGDVEPVACDLPTAPEDARCDEADTPWGCPRVTPDCRGECYGSQECDSLPWPSRAYDECISACFDRCANDSRDPICLPIQLTPEELDCATDVPRYTAACYRPCPDRVDVGGLCEPGGIAVCTAWQGATVCLAP